MVKVRHCLAGGETEGTASQRHMVSVVPPLLPPLVSVCLRVDNVHAPGRGSWCVLLLPIGGARITGMCVRETIDRGGHAHCIG
jgi:hypothetical protein